MREACEELTAQLNFTSELYSTYIALCAINGMFSIIATVGNLFVIVAIYKNGTLHTPSYVLLSALAISDLGIGTIAQPLFIAFKVVEIQGNLEQYCILGIAWHVIALFLAGFSFMTITSISIDRYLAVYLSTKYRHVVTVRRAIMISVGLAFVALVISSLYLVHLSVCLFAQTFVIGFCLFLTSFNSFKIIRMLRQHEKIQVSSLANNSTQTGTVSRARKRCTGSNISRFRKSVNILLYVYGVFLLCYTPYLCYRIVLQLVGRTATIHGAFSVSSTVVFINSSLNPPLYLWRIPEIRVAVFRILKVKTPYERAGLDQSWTIQSKWRRNDNRSTIFTHSPNMKRGRLNAWTQSPTERPKFSYNPTEGPKHNLKIQQQTKFLVSTK